jgi:SSS family solute:Na+ symporter
MMVQRTLCAKSIGDAKKAYLLMGFAAFFIYFLFMVSGVLFYSYYDGREFENGNTIILRFASDYGFPGLIGILAAAVVAASMSSLDSALNSLSTISTVDFYKRFVRGSAPRGHFLKVSRVFTVIWAVLIVIPALGYSMTEGSILQILSSVGALFVGSQLAMFALGFFSPTTTENGLLAGVAGGFIAVALVAHFTEVAWPWYCLIGAAVTALVAIPASFLIDGQAKTSQVSPYTIQGQRALAATGAQAVKEGGWHTVPGRVDKVSYLLLVFLGLTLLFMVFFPHLV